MVRTTSLSKLPSKAPARKAAQVSSTHMVRINHLHPHIAAMVRADHPELKADGMIDAKELEKYRMQQVQDILLEEHGEISKLDHEVAASIAKRGTISANVDDDFDGKRTFGNVVADKIATFGGSWTFILSFLGFLAVWIFINVIHLMGIGFDPYPFILLNLLLSCLAALQAPVIMMSQNRQEAKDRKRSENDYQINLKAELEIRLLHEKLDHLVVTQLERVNEIEKIQASMLSDLIGKKRR